MYNNTGDECAKWIKRYGVVKAKRTRWLNLWQFIGDYVHMVKREFTENIQTEGDFLVDRVFDSTGPKANRKMAAALLGMLWQSGSKSIRLNPADGLEVTDEVKEYFDYMNSQVNKALDNPKCGLALALEEYMVDQGAFGTSGVSCFEGDEAPLVFKCWGVDEISIEEGRNGHVRTIYREYEVSVLQAVEDYGLENMSKKIQEYYKRGDTSERVKILQVITPRSRLDQSSDKDFLGFYIEMDAKTIIKREGFYEIPVIVSRFLKRRNEVYGRSPAMEALPDILELNATKEARISAIEKSLDPPLGVYDDSILGNEEIDTSAGGLSVFAASGRLQNRNPIFPLFTVETIREVDKSVEDLMTSINEHFYIDRLLDFNNKAEMTLGEAQMRNQIRAEGLGSLFNRQQTELFVPLLNRAVAVLWRNGYLGVIAGTDEESIALARGDNPTYVPDSLAQVIAEGGDFYKIEFITPAARMMEAAEAQGVMRAWEFAAFAGQYDPSVFDVLDADKSLDVIAKSMGAPSTILKSAEMIEQIRQQRAAQQQAQMEAQQVQEQMAAVKATAEAQGMAAEAANIQIPEEAQEQADMAVDDALGSEMEGLALG